MSNAALLKPEFHKEPISFFGVECFIKEWSMGERIKIEAYGKSCDSELKRMCYLLVYSLVDGDNKPLFTEKDMAALQDLPSGELLQHVGSIAKLNTIKTVDEAKKN